MLVSIIIPVYNSASLLQRCFNSCANQTHGDIEVILINDGSTDDSGQVCDLYAKSDSRFVVIHQENRGIPASRNRGLDNAVGEYVMFVDCDDYIESECVEVLLNAMLSTNSDCAIGGRRVISEKNGEKISETIHKFDYGIKSREDALLYPFDSDLPVPTAICGVIRKMSVLAKYAIRFDEKLYIHDDILFTRTYSSVINRICTVENVLYNHVRHIDSQRKNTSKIRKPEEIVIINYFQEQFLSLYRNAGVSENCFISAKNQCCSMRIGHFIGVCASGLSISELRSQFKYLCNCQEMKLFLNRYIPRGNRSRAVPFLLKHKMLTFAIFAARVHNKKISRYY